MKSRKKLPRIALVGRRNVGKSTLMNALLGRNRAIVEDFPGLTRDVLEVEIRRNGYHFLLSDTPGLDMESETDLDRNILKRARDYLDRVDGIILLMEPPGPEKFDHFLFELLRKNSIKTPLICAINKVDGAEYSEEKLLPFYEAGFIDLVAISAKGRWNYESLLEAIEKRIPSVKKQSTGESENEGKGDKEGSRSTVVSDDIDRKVALSIAIVGRPNAGKSSLFNRLLTEELSLVSEVPGTTRDTIDSLLSYYGKTIRVIDTAGLRKKSRVDKEKDAPDFFSMRRTDRAIQDCDVVIHLIDAKQGFTEFDKKIEGMIQKAKKPALIGVNKWDLIPDKNQDTLKEYTDRIHFLFPESLHIPILFISVQTGQRVGKLIETALALQEQNGKRIPTAQLNELVEGWNRGTKETARRSKIFYATQTGTSPPEFVLFVRDRKKIPQNVIAYFENQIRRQFSLNGIPFQVHFREKNSEKE